MELFPVISCVYGSTTHKIRSDFVDASFLAQIFNVKPPLEVIGFQLGDGSCVPLSHPHLSTLLSANPTVALLVNGAEYLFFRVEFLTV
jgi:hypothetical protein